jgi:hypothetical protein
MVGFEHAQRLRSLEDFLPAKDRKEGLRDRLKARRTGVVLNVFGA